MLIDIDGYCCFIARALVVVCTKYVHVHKVQSLKFHIRFGTGENMYMYKSVLKEKGRDLTQSHDKRPYTNGNVKRAKCQHKQRHKKFDYTAVADRLRTVSWSNYGHPTGVVNLVYGPNLPTPRNSRVI